MADKNAVKDLLSKALKAVDSMDESVTQTTKETISTDENASTRNQTAGTGGFRTELERLFPNVYGRSARFANNKRPSSAPHPRITCNNKKRKTLIKKKEKTVIRKFVCLGDKDQQEIPSAQEKRDLFVCGLGEKKIQLPLNGKYVDLRATLRKEFPKLSDTCGVELMCAEQGKKESILIPNGPAGMTVDYIAQFIGQGRIYIRPIQRSLDQTVVRSESSLPEEMCNSCLEFIPMDKLREHSKVCPKNSVVCTICLECIGDDRVSPKCCDDVFHSICLEEWLEHSGDSGAKCPVCNKVFFSISNPMGNNYSTSLITEWTERELLIPDSDRHPSPNSTASYNSKLEVLLHHSLYPCQVPSCHQASQAPVILYTAHYLVMKISLRWTQILNLLLPTKRSDCCFVFGAWWCWSKMSFSISSY